MNKSNPFILVLGIAQDGGYPHSGCTKQCCSNAWKNPQLKKHVTCIAIIDPLTKEKWIIDASPDFKDQLYMLNCVLPGSLTGIFISHAHSGHYTGLINLGKEVMNTNLLPVYAATRMKKFLQKNLPWNKLVKNKNIKLIGIQKSKSIRLNRRISITPFTVPHRDEFSETLGFRIEGNKKSAVFIPDIDCWHKWENNLIDLLINSDRLYIDGTFYNADELTKKRIKKVPHPLITDTVKILGFLPHKEKNKVHFIHLNHTNPCLKIKSAQRLNAENAGFRIAKEMNRFYI